MAQKRFRCAGCGKVKREGAAGQRYCGAAACQKKRRDRWRRVRYAQDATYRETAQASTAAWLESRGGAAAYYRDYRRRKRKKDRGLGGAADAGTAGESAKCASGREESAVSPPEASAKVDAKSDAKYAQPAVMTGRYLLVPAGGAKSDAIIVQLSVIAAQSGDLQRTTGYPGGA